MSDKKAMLTARVDRQGRVVCPVCQFKIPVPETHSLMQGIGICPNGHRFLINGECVAAFHHFLGKQGSRHSKEMLRNTEDTPKLLKDIQDEISEGGIVKP
jgi:hypothetical protein